METEIEVTKITAEPRSTMSGIVFMTIALTLTLSSIVLIAKYANPPTAPIEIEATQPPRSP